MNYSSGQDLFLCRRVAHRSFVSCILAIIVTFQYGCATPPAKSTDQQMSEVVLTAALEAEQAYDYDTAIRHFETLMERDPTNAKFIQGLARNLRYAGIPKDAVILLKDKSEISSTTPYLVLELAKAQLAASMLADAQETMERARALMSDDWQMHLVMGILEDRLEKFELAQQSYRKALELSPDNVAALNNLAMSLAMSGEIDEAIATLRKLADSENATSLTRQNLALLYGVKGKMSAASELAKRDLPPAMVEENISTYREFHE